MDIDKGLAAINEIDSAMKDTEDASRSLWVLKGSIYQSIKESLASGNRTDDPLRDFAIFHYDSEHEKALPGLRLLAQRLNEESGNPIVINGFRWRFAGRDARGSSSYIPVSQVETLGILDEGGYEIDDGFSFSILLKDHIEFKEPRKRSKGRIKLKDHVFHREGGKYLLEASDLKALSHYPGQNRFETNSDELKIFLDEGIPYHCRENGRVLNPGKYATKRRKYIRELNDTETIKIQVKKPKNLWSMKQD